MHVVSAGLTHDQYMRFRTAIKAEKVTCAAFVRILITTGLDAAQDLVNKGKIQDQVQTKIAALKKQIAELEAINIVTVTPAKSNGSRKSHKNIEGYILSVLSTKRMQGRDVVFAAVADRNCSKNGVYAALKKMRKNGKVVVDHSNGSMAYSLTK